MRYEIRAWDGARFQADTLDDAKAKVRDHLKQWMEDDDRLSWTMMKSADGEVIVGQVLSSVHEPTDIIATIKQGAT